MNHTTPSENPQQKKYKYRELLTHLQCCIKSPLSYKEQAEIVGCTKFFAKKVAKQNLLNGVITITPTTHKSSGRKLAGKNIYGRGENFDPDIHLINNLNFSIERRLIIYVMSENKNCQKSVLDIKLVEKDTAELSKKSKKFTTKKNYKENLYKYKFAKASGKPSARHFYSSYEEFLEKSGRKALFAKYGFENQVLKAPSWWFKDIKKLESALKLVQSKLSKKHKPFNLNNFNKFVSYLLKRGVFGWFRHCARETSLAISRPTLKRVEPFLGNDFRTNGYESLKELYKKHHLNISFSNVQKLARHGYSKLFTAAEVMLKRLKLPGIKDVNAFMHHLISMKEPYDILRKRNA